MRPMTYPEMFPPEDGDYRPLAVSMNLLIDRFDRATADVVMEQLAASDAAMRAVQIRVMGGAMARVPWDATAFAHRTRKILINVACFYEGDADKPIREAWMHATTAAIREAAGATDTCAYVNFVNDEGPERIHDIYPDATYRRLAEIKRRYDTGNQFLRNQNVPPA
jgi:hypothetical protein